MTTRTELVRSILDQHGKLTTAATAISTQDSLYGAGLTSHASVNVMLAIEDHFDIEFPERFLKRSTFESVERLVFALDELLGDDRADVGQ